MASEPAHRSTLAYRCLDLAQLAVTTLALVSAIGLAPLLIAQIYEGLTHGMWLSSFCQLQDAYAGQPGSCRASSPWRFTDVWLNRVMSDVSVLLLIFAWYAVLLGLILGLRIARDRAVAH